MRTTATCALLVSLSLPAPRVSAQVMTPEERASALGRARAIAACLDRHHNEMQRIMRMVVAAERQRDTARDEAARRDARAAIDSLLQRTARVQSGARECLGEQMPQPGTVVREPPPDPSAAAVAGSQGSLNTVERDVALTSTIHVVRATQVDGHGQMEPHAVRSAVRRAVPRIERCYGEYLDRGSMSARHLDLVFTFRGNGAARLITIENSDFSDARFLRCMHAAAQRIRAASGPRGGEAQFSYRLRFGRAPN